MVHIPDDNEVFTQMITTAIAAAMKEKEHHTPESEAHEEPQPIKLLSISNGVVALITAFLSIVGMAWAQRVTDIRDLDTIRERLTKVEYQNEITIKDHAAHGIRIDTLETKLADRDTRSEQRFGDHNARISRLEAEQDLQRGHR